MGRPKKEIPSIPVDEEPPKREFETAEGEFTSVRWLPEEVVAASTLRSLHELDTAPKEDLPKLHWLVRLYKDMPEIESTVSHVVALVYDLTRGIEQIPD